MLRGAEFYTPPPLKTPFVAFTAAEASRLSRGPKFWAAAEGGGGQNVSREFGGGGDALQSVLSKTTFGCLRNWGWSGWCLFL